MHKTRIKHRLYKSLILAVPAVLLNGFVCITASRTEMKHLEEEICQVDHWTQRCQQQKPNLTAEYHVIADVSAIKQSVAPVKDDERIFEPRQAASNCSRKRDVKLTSLSSIWKKLTKKARGKFALIFVSSNLSQVVDLWIERTNTLILWTKQNWGIE